MAQLTSGQLSLVEDIPYGEDQVDSEHHNYFDEDLRNDDVQEETRESKKENEIVNGEDEKQQEVPLMSENLPHKRTSRKHGKNKPRKVHQKTIAVSAPDGGRHQDQGKERKRDRGSLQSLDIMSDQGHVQRRRRRLHKRTQMRKFHSMEADIEKAGRDRLEQKFHELEELVARPLADSRGLQLPRQQLQKMVALKHVHTSNSYRSGRGHGVQEEESEDSQAYSSIRVLQTVGSDTHFHSTNHKSHCPLSTSVHQRKNPSKPNPRKSSIDSLPTSSSGTEISNRDTGVHHGSNSSIDHNHDTREKGERREKQDENLRPSRARDPRKMHLKYSDSPELLEWLKRKNAEFRQQKKAERTKRREDRVAAMVDMDRKQIRRAKSEEQVKEWMEMKRREAAKREKEERKRRKIQAQQVADQKNSRNTSSSLTISRIDRPTSASTPTPPKKYIPIKRPESAELKVGSEEVIPKPPESKFVYKRPVSGRVRLMKLQSERSSKDREDRQRNETISPEEKLKRARMSYDAWLIAKRKEDIQKRKEAEKQNNLIKSDPEMERIVPEMAKKRIERIKNGKKSIDTGMKKIDQHLNKSFGGGNFEEEDGVPAEDGGDNVPNPSSYKLCVEGSAASLVEVTSRSRPVSAKARMPIPQSSFSPRRTKSAVPKVDATMNQTEDPQVSPFKLPFPDDLGAPEHVQRVQERLFSQQLIKGQSKRSHPESQDTAAAGGVSARGSDKDSASRRSLILLQEIEAAAQEQEGAREGGTRGGPETVPERDLFVTELPCAQDCSDKQLVSGTTVMHTPAKTKNEPRVGAAVEKVVLQDEWIDNAADNTGHRLQREDTENAAKEKVKQTPDFCSDDITRSLRETETKEHLPPESVAQEERNWEYSDADQGHTKDDDGLHRSLPKHVSFSEEATVYKVEESADAEISEEETEQLF